MSSDDKGGFDTYEAWLASRPECVQKLAREFPPNTRVLMHGKLHWVIGYDEGDSLLITVVDPIRNYDRAKKMMVKICAAHLREAAPS